MQISGSGLWEEDFGELYIAHAISKQIQFLADNLIDQWSAINGQHSLQESCALVGDVLSLQLTGQCLVINMVT
jgi:hypothetical protein